MNILNPIKVGKTELKNRLMFSPLTTGYESKTGDITAQSIAFYSRLAQGGVGYIVVGDVSPIKGFTPTPKLFDDSQIAAFANLVESVQANGAKIGAQIFYPEYDIDALMELFAQNKMQEVRQKLKYDMEHFTNQVSPEKLAQIIETITACAVRAAKAGCDAIQIHGDRLLGTLCSSKMNKRHDQFGGDFYGRTKFALLLVQSIRKALPDIILDYKLAVISPNKGRGGIMVDEAAEFARLLQENGVDMLHIAQGNHTGNLADTIPPMGLDDYGFFTDIAAQIKKQLDIPVSVVGRIVNPALAEQILSEGKADIVAASRALLADPDWINKISQGKPDLIRHCIYCNRGCTDAIAKRSAVSCVLNAENGHESEYRIVAAAGQKNVLIVGAGAAGLECARVAALRGHKVMVYEKENHAGGQINLAAIPPRKSEILRAAQDLEKLALAAGAQIVYNREIKQRDILQMQPDIVVVAVGAHSASLNIDVAKDAIIYDGWDLLLKENIADGKYAIIGGGLVGCEIAEYLAKKGQDVAIIEMSAQIAGEEGPTILLTMLKSFAEYKVEIYSETVAESIAKDGIICTKEGQCFKVDADFTVVACGSKSNVFPVEQLIENGIKVFTIGDCNQKAGDIAKAIREGYLVANEL